MPSIVCTAAHPSACRLLCFYVVALLAGGWFVSVHAADSLSDLGPAGPVVKVASGFAFVEGPADDGRGNIYFTDIPPNRIHVLGADGKVTLWTDDSHGANGLMFTSEGKLLACSSKEGDLAEWDVATKTRRVVAAGYDGTRFNSTNDLVIDSHGGAYLTDPHYNSPTPLPQKVRGVYYVAADGTVTRVVEDLPAPNGILLSRDEKTLYVAPTESATLRAYAVLAPGKLGPEQLFCKLRMNPGDNAAGSDGCTLDERGNLYVTTSIGIQVVSPAGKLLGVIEFPEQAANCVFGGPDGKMLYATARTSVYSVPMRVKGHRYGGDAKAASR